MKLDSLSPFALWLILMAITLVSTLAAERHVAPRFIALIVFGLAGIKAHMVVMEFMEAKHAAPHWRNLYQIWVGGVATVLIASHMAAG